MKNRSALIALAALTLTSIAAYGQATAWKVDPAHSGVEFQIRHLGVSNVRGSFSNVSGTVNWDEKNPEKSSVEAVIDATTVTTRNEMRDKHLKSPDFFDITKYPTLAFKSNSVKRVNGKLQVFGDLTLGGQTKAVTLDVEEPAAPQTVRGKTVSGFSATGLLKRADFNFGPKYAPPMLGDEIKFTIDLEVGK